MNDIDDYFNPFPPIGYRRVWSKEYIDSRRKSIDYNVVWKNLGKLVSVNIDCLAPFPGIYSFVIKYPLLEQVPIKLNEVIYIGKSTNIKKRFQDYLADKKNVEKKSRLKMKVRDNIKIMFEEYGNNIDVYYAEIPPDRITNIEDIYIQILDPILNSSQKLDEDKFISYESTLAASFESVIEDAFIENIDDKAEKTVSDLSFCIPLDDSKSAF